MPTSYEEYRGKSAGVTVEEFEDILDIALRKITDRMDAIEEGLADIKATTSGFDAKLTATRPFTAPPAASVDLAALEELEERLTAAIAAGTASSVEADIDRNLDVTEFYDSVEGSDFYEGFVLGKKFHLLSEAEELLGQSAKEAGYKTVVGRFVNGEFAGLSDERHLRAYQALKKGAPAPAPARKPAPAKKPTAKKAVPASDETSAPTAPAPADA